MSDTLSLLRNTLLEQRETADLIKLPAGLITQAEEHLQKLKTEYQQTGADEIADRHEALASSLDDLQETRADLIWSMAYNHTGPTKHMTDNEREIFDQLVPLGARLRGVE